MAEKSLVVASVPSSVTSMWTFGVYNLTVISHGYMTFQDFEVLYAAVPKFYFLAKWQTELNLIVLCPFDGRDFLKRRAHVFSLFQRMGGRAVRRACAGRWRGTARHENSAHQRRALTVNGQVTAVGRGILKLN
jgi:hypothetical protein